MESYYPEVLEKRDFIEKIVKSEEESFAALFIQVNTLQKQS